jgi:GNAT superfamily N-acetyltransferase
MEIKSLKTHDEIAQAFDAFVELRPHLTNQHIFVAQVIEQQKEGYEMIAILKGDEVVTCIGFRMMTMLAWGKILYIDDLITKEIYRGKGYGKILLDLATKIAKDNECDQVHLDTGYGRHAAHRVYLNQGFELHCHHLVRKLT